MNFGLNKILVAFSLIIGLSRMVAASEKTNHNILEYNKLLNTCFDSSCYKKEQLIKEYSDILLKLVKPGLQSLKLAWKLGINLPFCLYYSNLEQAVLCKNGKFFIARDFEKAAYYLYDIEKDVKYKMEIENQLGEERRFRAAALSCDGKFLVNSTRLDQASKTSSLQLWNVETAPSKLLSYVTLNNGKAVVDKIFISRDARFLLIGIIVVDKTGGNSENRKNWTEMWKIDQKEKQALQCVSKITDKIYGTFPISINKNGRFAIVGRKVSNESQQSFIISLESLKNNPCEYDFRNCKNEYSLEDFQLNFSKLTDEEICWYSRTVFQGNRVCKLDIERNLAIFEVCGRVPYEVFHLINHGAHEKASDGDPNRYTGESLSAINIGGSFGVFRTENNISLCCINNDPKIANDQRVEAVAVIKTAGNIHNISLSDSGKICLAANESVPRSDSWVRIINVDRAWLIPVLGVGEIALLIIYIRFPETYFDNNFAKIIDRSRSEPNTNNVKTIMQNYLKKNNNKI